MACMTEHLTQHQKDRVKCTACVTCDLFTAEGMRVLPSVSEMGCTQNDALYNTIICGP